MASGKNNVEVLPQIEKVCVPFADAAHQATESSSATSVALSTVLTSFDECKVVGAEGSEQAYVPDTNLVPLHAIAVASLKDGEDDNEFIAMEDKEALAAMIECTSEPLKTAVTEKSLGAAELRHDDSSYCVTVSSHGPMDIAEEHSYSYRQGIIAIKPIKHIKEPPEYACLLCPFKTRHRSSFRSHHLLHTGEKPHKCEVCGRAFRLSYSLLQHMRTHTGERPYHCYVCDRSFTVHCTWRIHMRKHTGERPYRCEICNKAFVTLYTLKKHSHLHSREKP